MCASVGVVMFCVLPAAVGHGDESWPFLAFASAFSLDDGNQRVSDLRGCAAAPVIGTTTVATLNRTPLVTVFANGFPLILVLDTGAQRTVLTPAVAQRIGGKRPLVEFQRGLRAIAGTLPSREIE